MLILRFLDISYAFVPFANDSVLYTFNTRSNNPFAPSAAFTADRNVACSLNSSYFYSRSERRMQLELVLLRSLFLRDINPNSNGLNLSSGWLSFAQLFDQKSKILRTMIKHNSSNDFRPDTCKYSYIRSDCFLCLILHSHYCNCNIHCGSIQQYQFRSGCG